MPVQAPGLAKAVQAMAWRPRDCERLSLLSADDVGDMHRVAWHIILRGTRARWLRVCWPCQCNATGDYLRVDYTLPLKQRALVPD